MRNLLSIILFSLYLLPPLAAQDIHQVKKFSDEQFAMGNYQLALKEYQRVLFFDRENRYNELYSRIASIHYQLSDFDNAIKYYDLALNIENNDSIKFEIKLNKALCNFNQGNYLLALYELLDLPDHPSGYLSDKKNLYMAICHYGLDEYEESREYFAQTLDSTGAAHINTMFSDFENFNRKYRPSKVQLMSILLPGLGQIHTGEVFNGINSFLLVSGISYYAVYTALNYGIIDGLLILSSWFVRYYTGGYTNASNFAVKKIDDEKSRVYSEILTLIETYQNQTAE